MISYDDIVKAGSNIGGWEGKRGFYAVERYYEMAEKLRVQVTGCHCHRHHCLLHLHLPSPTSCRRRRWSSMRRKRRSTH